jgi:hypothetical protein
LGYINVGWYNLRKIHQKNWKVELENDEVSEDLNEE